LELSEYITHVSTQRVPEELYERVREYYGEKEYVDLVLLINHINSLNRLAIAMGDVPAER
jgi:alkylhydroperoxidase family enzyme